MGIDFGRTRKAACELKSPGRLGTKRERTCFCGGLDFFGVLGTYILGMSQRLYLYRRYSYNVIIIANNYIIIICIGIGVYFNIYASSYV